MKEHFYKGVLLCLLSQIVGLCGCNVIVFVFVAVSSCVDGEIILDSIVMLS